MPPKIQLTDWKVLAHPYYQLEFHSPDIPSVMPGDAITQPSITPQATLFFPIMSIDVTKQKLSCLFKAAQTLNPASVTEKLSSNEHHHFLYVASKHKTCEPAKNLLLLAQDEHLASLILHCQHTPKKTNTIFAIIEMNDTLFFQPKPSSFIVQGINPSTTASVPLLEDWGIISRIACSSERPGCYHGSALQLSRTWLAQQTNGNSEFKLQAYGHRDFVAASKQLLQNGPDD